MFKFLAFLKYQNRANLCSVWVHELSIYQRNNNSSPDGWINVKLGWVPRTLFHHIVVDSAQEIFLIS